MTPEERKLALARQVSLEQMLVELQAQQRLQLEALAALSAHLGCVWAEGSWSRRQAELEEYYFQLHLAVQRGDGVPPAVPLGEPLAPIPPGREP